MAQEHSKENSSKIREVGKTSDVTCCVQPDLPKVSWDRIFHRQVIFCFHLESCPSDLKSGGEKLFAASQACHPDYSLDHQTRDDPVTCLHEGVLPALATPAAGTALQDINSSPAIQETTCAGSQQPGLHQTPVWKSLNSFLHYLSWRTTDYFHFSFS